MKKTKTWWVLICADTSLKIEFTFINYECLWTFYNLEINVRIRWYVHTSVYNNIYFYIIHSNCQWSILKIKIKNKKNWPWSTIWQSSPSQFGRLNKLKDLILNTLNTSYFSAKTFAIMLLLPLNNVCLIGKLFNIFGTQINV